MRHLPRLHQQQILVRGSWELDAFLLQVHVDLYIYALPKGNFKRCDLCDTPEVGVRGEGMCPGLK